jgi:hypothetical protein
LILYLLSFLQFRSTKQFERAVESYLEVGVESSGESLRTSDDFPEFVETLRNLLFASSIGIDYVFNVVWVEEEPKDIRRKELLEVVVR